MTPDSHSADSAAPPQLVYAGGWADPVSNEKELDRFLMDHRDRLLDTARRYVGDNDAEDLTQRASVVAANKLKSGPVLKIGPYVRAVMQKERHRLYRDRTRQAERNVASLESEPPDPATPSPDAVASRRELVKEINAALAQLDLEEADLVRQHFTLGRTLEALAATHGTTRNKIHATIQRVLQGMRAYVATERRARRQPQERGEHDAR